MVVLTVICWIVVGGRLAVTCRLVVGWWLISGYLLVGGVSGYHLAVGAAWCLWLVDGGASV